MYKKIDLNVGNSVDYFMGRGALKEGVSILEPYSKVFVLVDEMTEKHCLPVLRKYWKKSDQAQIIRIPSGEVNKNLQTLNNIWSKLTFFKADKDHLLVNLGGGVITDMGGFAAALYKRGMSFVHVPTTLLGQVDAAIGGKTGIDYNDLKNHIGLILNSNAVVIDPVFLNTLDENQWRSGFAEILKYGLIMDVELWKMLQGKSFKSLNSDEWERLITRSAIDKISIVQEDGLEKGLRNILNFGHTIGHALESYFLNIGYPITHGEAVAAGMICESWISHQQTGLKPDDFENIVHLIDYNFSRLKFSKNQITD